MTLDHDLTIVNAYADFVATFRVGTFAVRTAEERQLRQQANAILGHTLDWPTIEKRDGQHSVLSAPDGTLILYSYEQEGEQFVERLRRLTEEKPPGES